MPAISEYTPEIVSTYVDFRKPIGLDIIKEQLLTFTQPKNQINILDLGCGSGNYTKALSKMGYQLTSVDYSENMLNSLRQWIVSEGVSNISTFKINLLENNNKELFEQKYHMILVNQVIHHFNDYQDNFSHLQNLFELVHHLLTNDGRFSLNTSNLNQHLYGMWWGHWFQPELTQYCLRYCPFLRLIELADAKELKLIQKEKCTQPFIGEKYFQPETILNPEIRKSDTLWKYIPEDRYNDFCQMLKGRSLPLLFDKYNGLEKWGQSTFFIFQKKAY